MGVADAGERGQKPVRKAVITGFTVVAEMVTGGLFMENIKMEKQRTSKPYPYLMKNWLSKAGLSGWLAGFWPWGFALAMSKGTVLGASRAFFLNNFEKHMDRKKADLFSGFAAGGVQGIFMSPILLARVRVGQRISDERVTGGLLYQMKLSGQVLTEGIRKEGVGLIFKGMPMMVFKRSLDWGSRFIFFSWWREFFAAYHPDTPLTNMERLGSSFLGGAMSVAVTQPIDRMVPIIMQAGKAGDVGVVTFMRQSIAQQGMSTIWRGAVMRTIHCGWHTAFAIFIANKIYESIDKVIPA